MAQSIEDLEARVAALEARVAALEAKVKPSGICIYADHEYGPGAVIKQDDDHYYTCTLGSSGVSVWEKNWP